MCSRLFVFSDLDALPFILLLSKLVYFTVFGYCYGQLRELMPYHQVTKD